MVPANGVEPLSRAYESLVLTVELRRRLAIIIIHKIIHKSLKIENKYNIVYNK